MATPDARSVALAILDLVRKGQALATAALRDEQFKHDLEPGVAAAANRLALGVLRDRLLLDAMLTTLATRTLPRKDKRLLDLLRLALFELLYADTIPDYATVDRFVDLARRTKGASVARFVNAMLRRAATEAETLRGMRGGASPGLRYSWPDWLLALGREAFGETLADELARFHEPAHIDLRAVGPRDKVLAELQDEGLHPEALPENEAGFRLPPDEPPYALMPFIRGRIFPMDRASQLVAEMVAHLAGERVLEGCAGRGTKTLALRRHLATEQLLSVDLLPNRVAELHRRVPAARAEVVDLTAPPFAPASFDTVFLDAPCTGLGTIRRHPELKWRRTPADVAANARTQRALLSGCAPLVAPNGRLIYAVCSFAPAEGPRQVNRFLTDHPQFTRDEEVAAALPAPLASLWQQLPDGLTRPSLLDGDLFYVALLRRHS